MSVHRRTAGWLRGAAAALAVISAPAAELVVRDVRIGFEYLPTDFDYELTAPQGTRSGSDSFESTYGISLGSDWSLVGAGSTHGLVVGGELLVAQVTYADGDGMLYGARVEAGYAWAITDRWSVAAYALGGGGMMSFDLSAADSFPDYNASGTWFDYGAELRVQFNLTDHAAIALEGGWQAISADLSGDDIDLTLDLAGPAASLTFTWRFTTAPAPLD
ncbi:MAG TPA: hypothetical protein VEL07_01545 [Planctomycetota bacterium]|nr:hypothetical protein [Planctomycetota bacterium]